MELESVSQQVSLSKSEKRNYEIILTGQSKQNFQHISLGTKGIR
jgi:hypothetical protein